MSMVQTKQTTAKGLVQDLSFQEYIQRQLFEISPERVLEKARDIRQAGSFSHVAGEWLPSPYPGFAVVSLLSENNGNEELTGELEDICTTLKEQVQPRNALFMLPSESYHQTIANTLSANRFTENILDKGLEPEYPFLVKHAFDHIPPSGALLPIRMKLIGLSIFGTAIGMLGIFKEEKDYSYISGFRSAFYEDPALKQLDVRMTRPFIGHITLAYIEAPLNKNQKEHIGFCVNEINEQIKQKSLYFNMYNTELRRYEHLAEFNTASHYPSHQF